MKKNHIKKNEMFKNYQIETEKGVETFSFKDSIDEYRANQLVTQYLLAEYSPINPDTFMAIFNEKMKKNGITDSMGIVYRYKGQPQYSNNDSLSPRTAYCTTIQFLDARETVSGRNCRYEKLREKMQENTPVQMYHRHK